MIERERGFAKWVLEQLGDPTLRFDYQLESGRIATVSRPSRASGPPVVFSTAAFTA